MPDVIVNLEPYLTPFSVIVEPWATDFKINPSERCTLVIHNETVSPHVSMAVEDNAMIVFVNNAGCTFRFMRGEIEELAMPIPTIALPPLRKSEG